ncbi:hypothetical protein R1sor_012294 [Riccia sorocarpa]|uniref:DUF7869 domain-containing protein n=1 Tax=Riccia sorocarpa TaxID=122646 RepID=A0ABD3I3C7_9MARC
MDVANSDPGRVIPKSSEFNRKRTKNTLPEISRTLQHDFGGIDPSASDPSGHRSGSGSSPSSDSEDSTDFSPIKIVEKDLGLSPVRLLLGFAPSKKRKQFLTSMSPPRVLFSQFPSLAPLGNDEIEEHKENAQDENEDDGPFASEALSDSEEENNPEQVPVTGHRFKETLREEKPPRVQVGNSRKRRPGEVDSGFVLSKLTPECLNREQRQFCCRKTCVWNLGINRLRSERKRYFRLSRTERAVYLESLVTKLEKGGVVFRLSHNLTVCRKAFKIIFCVGNSRLQRLRLPDKHHASIDTVARQPSAEAFILLEWLDSFFLSHCERQLADGKYHLPNNFTKKEVYDHYRTDMVQAEERAAAGRRRWKALDSPKDCAYIQIDGMDQKKTALPHFSKQPKSVDGAALVGVHLVGAMIFHGKLRTRAFLTYNNLKSDSNLTIIVLQKILLEWEGILPPTLYLQLDNTVRENKNNILFAYLAMLLEKKFSTENTWEPPAGVRNILHIDASRAILASEQVPLKSYAEIKRQTRRVQNIGPVVGRQEGEAEEIGRNISNNRRERLLGDMCWFWPVPPERDEHVVDELVAVTTTEEFRRRIFGQRRPIYSGPRRPPPGSAAADRAAHIGELTEIHDKSFLAVLADDETSFWICQVLKINRRNEEGEPTSVLIQWYATEDSNPYTGKFYPEKRRTNGKGRAALFRQEIDLEEVTVLSFNFNFTTARRVRKITERQIRTCLFRIARDKEASQPEGINRLSPTIDSVDDEETECSGPDLEDEEE